MNIGFSKLARMADVVEFGDTSEYDETLVGRMEAVLKTPGRKLIILHIRGSHEPPGNNYPAAMRKFSGDIREDDYYDDSIHYTDYVIGKIFKALENRRASVLYYSDHALIRVKTFGKWVYKHAVGHAKKEAAEIPMWIWWADKSKAQRLGTVEDLYCTEENYNLVRDWLGIKTKDASAPSPLTSGWKSKGDYPVWISNSKATRFGELDRE
ncbi:MAG: sulfatase-like hydrolase/transferase [Opitutaceae bacterium]|jgi:glucan phosphoethanolaminetransferase (alkaline phosphatase superfamily)|nr:sulfatase-like hydrolase/transferase [Opitutaceae bacterium]